MTLEELKAEAKKHGYNLIKQKEKVYLLPCVCGCNRRAKWYSAYSITLKCNNCGRSATGDTELDAKKQWNRMVEEWAKQENTTQ